MVKELCKSCYITTMLGDEKEKDQDCMTFDVYQWSSGLILSNGFPHNMHVVFILPMRN